MGTRLVEQLKKAGNVSIKNIDKQPSRFYPEITVIGNVLDRDALVPLLKGSDVVVLLAAEHRDDVSPVSLYYDVNVEGMRNVLSAMEENGIRRIVFTSSVAVYGLNKPDPAEDYPVDPFNHYGKSKWQAEQVLQEWYSAHPDYNINILRPTVIFGERNRGNVYNLLKQISGGRFMMVGNGTNEKSMSYVGNIVALIQYLISEQKEGYNIFNYADKPDFDMNSLVALVSRVLNRHIPAIHLPYWLGMSVGYGFDVLAMLTRKKMSISSVRVKKFCAVTRFNADRIRKKGFIPPYSLNEGLERTLNYEFVRKDKDDIIFISE